MNKLFSLVLLIGVFCSAEVKMPALFKDGMVLQRNKPVHVWGWAAAKEKVTVSFGGQTATVTSDANGKWLVTLKEMKANATGSNLVIKGSNEITIKDVLVGEVWLCSGQSNMQWSMRQSSFKNEDIPKANFPKIRLFYVPRKTAPSPVKDVTGAWNACTPKTVTNFSAVGYNFGMNLHKKLNVPVGLICSSWGGTQIEPWTPIEGFNKVPSLASYAKAVTKLKSSKKAGRTSPSAIYNAMIYGLAPFSMRGAIWYQGESNVFKGDTVIYTDKTKALVEGWRHVFKQEDLSFYFVQIAPFSYVKPNKKKRHPSLDEYSLAKFWDAQTACMKAIKNCGMVVITDITGNVNNIHPGNKRDVGYRLSLWALNKNYGKSEVVYSGPQFKSMEIKGNKAYISFDHIGGGLKSLNGKPLTHFKIAGADKKFVDAKAVIEGDKVVVSAEGVATPVAVRFGWHQLAMGNFGNKEKLPAIQFRTDNW